jgi:uncharacterized protein DUF3307
MVHSASGGVIKRVTLTGFVGGQEEVALKPREFILSFTAEGFRLSFPPMSASVPLGALIGWMVLLTVKHVIADFVLQTSWMAIGKDQKTGWFLPLLAHCGVHFAVILAVILAVAPRFWFVAVIDFVIHITVDFCKGRISSHLGVTQENHHPWFWTLIGVDQALHHLTDFGLSIFMAAN